MGFFDVDFGKLVKIQVPELLRTSIRLAWLRLLVSEVKAMYEDFMLLRADVLYFVRYNGQVVHLTWTLNKMFDPVEQRITITDTDYAEAVWLYLDDEVNPVFTPLEGEDEPVWLYTEEEIAAADAASVFIVNVPAVVAAMLGYSSVRLTALVNKYRLPGMSAWEINVY